MKTQLAYSFAIGLLVFGCGSDTAGTGETSGGSGGVTSTAIPSDGSEGGATDGDATSGGSDAEAGATTAGGTTSTDTVTTSGGSEAAGGSVSTGGTCSTTYYRDADGDSWGGPETSCTNATGWVARTGDCNDSNALVFPNQTLSFTEAYIAADGTLRFDYDCDGVESTASGKQISTGDCQTSSAGNACTGDGYLPVEPSRTGTQLNQTCGSTRYLVCARSQLVCIGAIATDGSHEAISCK